MQQLLSSQVSLALERLFVSLHVGPAQLLYMASNIALALLAHPVSAAGLRGDFPIGESAVLACERRAGTNRDAE